jgi:hypothetical protein
MKVLKNLGTFIVAYLKIAAWSNGFYQLLSTCFILILFTIGGIEKNPILPYGLTTKSDFLDITIYATIFPVAITYPFILFFYCINAIIVFAEGKPVIETIQKQVADVWDNKVGPNDYPFYPPGILALMKGKQVALYFFPLWAPIGACIAAIKFWPEKLFPDFDEETVSKSE